MKSFKDKLFITLPVLYGAGFLIHNLYLSSFNSFEFELIQAKYIFSGIFLALVVVSYIVLLVVDLDISYLPNNRAWRRLLPLILRFSCLPALTITVIHGDEYRELLGHESSNFNLLLFSIYLTLGSFILTFKIIDTLFELSKGGSIGAVCIRFFSYVLALPMLACVIYLSSINDDVSNLLYFSSYIAALIFGLAMSQADKKYGYEPHYVAPESQEEDKEKIHLVVGLIAIFVVGWNLASIYTQAIYSNVPVALGGAKKQQAFVFQGETKLDVRIIQETSDWVLVEEVGSNEVVKIRTTEISKIVYVNNKD